jgi:hypothetical protein
MNEEFREQFNTEEQAAEFYKGLTYFPSERLIADEPEPEAAPDGEVWVVTFRKIDG